MMTREERKEAAAAKKEIKKQLKALEKEEKKKEARKNETPEEKKTRVKETLNTVKEVGISTAGIFLSVLGAEVLSTAIGLPIASKLPEKAKPVGNVVVALGITAAASAAMVHQVECEIGRLTNLGIIDTKETPDDFIDDDEEFENKEPEEIVDPIRVNDLPNEILF